MVYSCHCRNEGKRHAPQNQNHLHHWPRHQQLSGHRTPLPSGHVGGAIEHVPRQPSRGCGHNPLGQDLESQGEISGAHHARHARAGDSHRRAGTAIASASRANGYPRHRRRRQPSGIAPERCPTAHHRGELSAAGRRSGRRRARAIGQRPDDLEGRRSSRPTVGMRRCRWRRTRQSQARQPARHCRRPSGHHRQGSRRHRLRPRAGDRLRGAVVHALGR